MAYVSRPRNGLIYPRGVVKPTPQRLDPSHPLSRGLALFCPLGDDTGGFILDLGPNNSNPHITNGPLPQVAGPRGGLASSFTAASSQFVQIDGQIGFVNGTGSSVVTCWTLSCWGYKLTSGAQTMLAGYNGSNQAAFYFRIDGNSGFTHAGGFQEATTSSPALNTWVHYALVYTGSSLVYYINGALSSTTGVAGGSVDTQIGINNLFTIGRIGASSSSYWNGYLDNVRVYLRPLPNAEIARLYAEPYAGVFSFPVNLVTTTAVSANVNLAGVSATASVGSFGLEFDGGFSLTGASATAAAGTLGLQYDNTLGLVGVAATAFAGDLTADASVAFALDGVEATAYAGDLSPVTNFLTVPMITIMNANPIPIDGDMVADDVAMEGDLPYQLAFEGVINTNPIPMAGTMSAVPVPGEGSVP